MGHHDVAVTRFAGDFFAEPIRWDEFAAGFLIVEFYFRDDHTIVSAGVNVHLDDVFLPGNVAPDFR